jgi:uncharacterized membrane protein YfcA
MNDGIITSIAFLGCLLMTDCFDLLTSLGHVVGLLPASSWALMGVGFAAGIAAGLLGIGGGLMILAMMSGLQLIWPHTVIGWLSFTQLTGFAALQSFTASVSATTVHAMGRRICYKTAAMLGGVALLGGYLGGRWSALWNEAGLRLLMAVMLLILMAFYWLKTAKESSSPPNDLEISNQPAIKAAVPWWAWLICFSVAFVTGIASGLLGIGGSVFLIPLMVGLLWVPLSHSSGSGSATAVLIAGASVIGKAQAGLIDWPHALLMAGAGMAGGAVGAQWMPHIPPKVLRILFVIMMISATINALSGLFSF